MEKKPDRSEIIAMTLLFALTLVLTVLKVTRTVSLPWLWVLVRFGLAHIGTVIRAACAGRFLPAFFLLGDAEILVNLHDTLPAEFHQIFKGDYGFAHL